MTHPFHYVAIPCENFERAYGFYSEITGRSLQVNPHVPFPMAYFVDKAGGYSGHIFHLSGFNPSSDGVLVYLNVDRPIDESLALIEEEGGRIIMPKTLIAAGKGYWALFLDPEGNRLAIHSEK